MTDLRQSKAYANFLTSTGWQVKKIAGVYVFIKRFPLLGNFIKIQRPTSLPPTLFTQLREKHRLFQIVVEPSTKSQAIYLTKRGYKKSRSPFLPSKTLVLNINKSKNILLADLKKDAKRSIAKTANLPLFTKPNLRTFHKSAQKAKFYSYKPSLSTLKALQSCFLSSSLLLASHNVETEQNTNSNLIYHSGAIFLLSGNTCYYYFAFSSPIGRASLLSYKLLWEGILWAKSKGAKYFDFEGIYDPRFPQKSWHGFTLFKKKFGGSPKSYPGAYTKMFLPLKLNKK